MVRVTSPSTAVYAAGVRDQAELRLRIGCGLDFAEQEAQQQPGAGQGQEGDTKSLPRSQQGEESEQQSGGDEHAGGDPCSAMYCASTMPAESHKAA